MKELTGIQEVGTGPDVVERRKAVFLVTALGAFMAGLLVAETEFLYTNLKHRGRLLYGVFCDLPVVRFPEVSFSFVRDENDVLPIVLPLPFLPRLTHRVLILKSSTSHVIYFGGGNFRARKFYRVHSAVERDNDAKE